MPGFRPGECIELFGNDTQTRNWVREHYPQCLVIDPDTGEETGELTSAYNDDFAIEYFPTLIQRNGQESDEILMIEPRAGFAQPPSGPGIRPNPNVTAGWAGQKRRPDDPDPSGRVISITATISMTEEQRDKLVDG